MPVGAHRSHSLIDSDSLYLTQIVSSLIASVLGVLRPHLEQRLFQHRFQVGVQLRFSALKGCSRRGPTTSDTTRYPRPALGAQDHLFLPGLGCVAQLDAEAVIEPQTQPGQCITCLPWVSLCALSSKNSTMPNAPTLPIPARSRWPHSEHKISINRGSHPDVPAPCVLICNAFTHFGPLLSGGRRRGFPAWLCAV